MTLQKVDKLNDAVDYIWGFEESQFMVYAGLSSGGGLTPLVKIECDFLGDFSRIIKIDKQAMEHWGISSIPHAVMYQLFQSYVRQMNKMSLPMEGWSGEIKNAD